MWREGGRSDVLARLSLAYLGYIEHELGFPPGSLFDTDNDGTRTEERRRMLVFSPWENSPPRRVEDRERKPAVRLAEKGKESVCVCV